MQITVKHCNNIDHAEISIVESKLNIKFAANGTGKSTLSKAIIYKAEGSSGTRVVRVY
jgi:Fe-S cluster assembly ATPase SufC